jgi:hypothetical protein
MTNEIVPIDERGWRIENDNHLKIVSKTILDSGITPHRSVNAIAAIIMRGRSLRLDTWEALENIYSINNRTVISSHLAMALVERSGLIADKEHAFSGNGSDRSCTVTVQRKGRKPKSWSFSMAQAKAADLLGKDSWKKWPDNMLYARALMFALRTEFSDVLHGMHAVEEFDVMADEEPVPEEKLAVVEEISSPRGEEPKPPQEEPPHKLTPQEVLLIRMAESEITEEQLLKLLHDLKLTGATNIADIRDDVCERIVRNWNWVVERMRK